MVATCIAPLDIAVARCSARRHDAGSSAEPRRRSERGGDAEHDQWR